MTSISNWVRFIY